MLTPEMKLNIEQTLETQINPVLYAISYSSFIIQYDSLFVSRNYFDGRNITELYNKNLIKVYKGEYLNQGASLVC